MSKLFPNLIIFLNKGLVYNSKTKRFIFTKINNDGYHGGNVYDIYGNHYKYCHEVIIAEGLQLPKHLWPTEPNGRRYIVDHILPVKNEGTDSIENLHLIPRPDNARNPISRKNNSKAKKEIYKNPEKRKWISELNKGRKLSNETKKKISESHKGKHHSPETEFKKGCTPWNKKKVYQYTKNGEFIKEWNTPTDVEKELGIWKTAIYMCCNGKLKSTGGFKWSYTKL